MDITVRFAVDMSEVTDPDELLEVATEDFSELELVVEGVSGVSGSPV